MEKFVYTPDEDVQVHQEGAIRLICQSFRSHDDGLPEWCKNASDAYVRDGVAPGKRVIVLFFANAKGKRPSGIGCLDFIGFTSSTIEERFRYWADPNAVGRNKSLTDLQGGHGNGGKCYMTQMFGDCSYLTTVRSGKGNRYGVAGRSIKFGFVPSVSEGKDFAVSDLKVELSKALSALGTSIDDLPGDATKSLNVANGFTLVLGINPLDIGNKLPAKELTERLISHPQMIRTLQLCSVYVVIDGRALQKGIPLALPEIPPMRGAEQPRVIPIPESLKDPLYGNLLSTTNNSTYARGTLTLKTSDRSMRWTRKFRHCVNYKGKSGYFGSVDVPELGVTSSYCDHIYGDCELDILDEYKTNERRRLADSPLTRAVEKWIAEQLDLYAKEFELRDKRRIGQEDRNSLAKMNEALDRWKDKFLQTVMDSLVGPGRDGVVTPPINVLPSGRVSRLELLLSHSRAGVGVALRPSLKFYDSKGNRVRPVPYRWTSDDTNIAIVDEELSVVNTFAFGKTEIRAETLDGRYRSNPVQLEVVRINEIEIVPERLDLNAGSKASLKAVCSLATGETSSDVYLVWTESDSNIARVSPAGVVFGFQIGETEVAAGDNHCVSKKPAKVIVRQGTGGGKGGNQGGKGFPRILVSEIDTDPETGEEVKLSPQDPPVYQRVQDVDRNLWWINSAAPFARMYMSNEKGYGINSREWRIYFLERYLEIMVKIVLNFDMQQGQELSFENWMQRWDDTAANMQTFASESLSSFIDSGILPGVK
jgi:hypothetical protein